MAIEGQTMHLTLQTALPLEENPENKARSELWDRPRLTTHKHALLMRTREAVRKAAASCLQRFEPHQDALWWQPAGKDGKPLVDKEGKPVKRIAGELQVVIKLRAVAPLDGFALPAAIKDGVHYKVADLLRSYAKRKLDPAFAKKTSYPSVGEGFPVVWQTGFRFLEHRGTGKLFLYVPLFPRGGHKENLHSHFDPDKGSMLQVFGSHEIESLSRTKGGLLLPLQFDKWGEATFIRDANNPPRWKARERQYDRRWLLELWHEKEFKPKRIELFMSEERIFVNVACEVACKPAVDTKNFIGVAFGLQDLLDIVVIDRTGNILHQRKVHATEYDETVFKGLLKFWREKRGEFRQQLTTLLYGEIARLVDEALRFQATIAVETVGNVPKGKYSPAMNRRLSFWPFGRLVDMLSYKSVFAGLPKPYKVYSTTVRGLCSSCGASNKNGEKQIALEGATYYCGSCKKKGSSGVNAALNLAHRALELSQKGVVAR